MEMTCKLIGLIWSQINQYLCDLVEGSSSKNISDAEFHMKCSKEYFEFLEILISLYVIRKMSEVHRSTNSHVSDENWN